jgi:hypothetical protein
MCSNSGLPVNIGVAVLTTGNLLRYQDDPNVDQYMVGSVPGQPEPADVQDLENDPKLQQIAKSMGRRRRRARAGKNLASCGDCRHHR